MRCNGQRATHANTGLLGNAATLKRALCTGYSMSAAGTARPLDDVVVECFNSSFMSLFGAIEKFVDIVVGNITRTHA